MFKNSLDLFIYYITQKPGAVIGSEYLKPTFKSKRTTLGI